MLEASQVAPERVRPLRREEYDKLVELGFFEGERVELLYGAVVEMSPHDPQQDSPIEILNELLVVALIGRARVRVQSSLAASDSSEPEPDIAVVPRADHSQHHPSSAWLVVEVAKSSLKKDRTVKAAIYAESNVEEYWVVDVVARTVEVYRDATNGTYQSVVSHRVGEVLSLHHFPDVSFDVGAIFQTHSPASSET